MFSLNLSRRRSRSHHNTPKTTNTDDTENHKSKRLSMRIFNREKKSSSSKRSSVSTDTSTTNTRNFAPRTSVASTPAPGQIETISVSVWNAAGQNISTLQPNHSSSNLSTTSTLLETTPTSTPAPRSSTRNRNSYGMFLAEAREADERTERMNRAWAKAEERRRASRNWPNDPWRGGFGPPSGIISRRRDGGAGALSPRRESNGEDRLRNWLRGNGLVH